MTRLNWDAIRDMDAQLRQRAGLEQISNQEIRDASIRQHDALMHAGTPLNQMRQLMAEVEPQGLSDVDFAVPMYFDDLYRNDFEEVPDVNVMSNLWLDSLLQASHNLSQFRNVVERLGEHAPAMASRITDDGVGVDELQRIQENRDVVLARAQELVDAGRVPQSAAIYPRVRRNQLTVEEFAEKVSSYAADEGIDGAERIYLESAARSGESAIGWDEAVLAAELQGSSVGVGNALTESLDRWPGISSSVSEVTAPMRGPSM